MGRVGAETQGASRHDGAVIQGGGEGSGAGFPGNNPTPQGPGPTGLRPFTGAPGNRSPGYAVTRGRWPRLAAPRRGTRAPERGE
ncbi:hypothetical protein MA03_02235 [Infirmifilum uzonense]|uniref:Uncharacterized protein n=1 Tax=Infirmifilum uzonense TaxID=1550241 RepID=A0A0F7FGP6_9CREN|nr:hypothetical protein MA03_02235 [Infirmifilum uzonense]